MVNCSLLTTKLLLRMLMYRVRQREKFILMMAIPLTISKVTITTRRLYSETNQSVQGKKLSQYGSKPKPNKLFIKIIHLLPSHNLLLCVCEGERGLSVLVLFGWSIFHLKGFGIILFWRSIDQSASYETKSWLEKVVIMGIARPVQISIQYGKTLL